MAGRAARHLEGLLGAAPEGGGDGRQELHRVGAAHARHRTAAASAAAAVEVSLRGGDADGGVRVEEVAAARVHGAHRVHRQSVVYGRAAHPLTQPSAHRGR
eukprot:scaffold105319_cov58-Phaeocystis_antarctica.AAC.6